MKANVAAGALALVVEDEESILRVVRKILESEGLRVESAQDGEVGLQRALELRPDLVVLDVGLPTRDGVDVARCLRERGFSAPLLMLTARGSVSERVNGLDAGADDYLAKPFEPAELMARVRALLRRAALPSGAAPLRVRDLTLDPISRQVQRDGRAIELTQKEYALLEFLMRNAGQPVTRQMIGEQVWKQSSESLTNVVDVYINYLRRKIEDDKLPPLIRTLRGIGYTLQP
ncbi:MAG: response regulator transcription factor [Gemmatimonadota bacterium]|nr:response regulator transcription factor [Gemmatimonadota bacterium]